MEEYKTLSRYQKVKIFAPKTLPIFLLSVILPTADVGTDLVLISKLYKEVTDCVVSDEMWRDKREYGKCKDDGADEYCTSERVSNNTVCGVSQYDCDRNVNREEYRRCQEEGGPDQYCTSERVSNNNTVCRLKKSSDSQYFCRYYKIWSSDGKDYRRCGDQGANKYCSDPASNHNVCDAGSRSKTPGSLLLIFFLLNYVMGLVTCIRLEGRKWVPLVTALFDVYPQYSKKLR